VSVELPAFRYHPDPLATGSIQTSDTVCVCCERARGFVYAGPVYAEDDLDDVLCPWCIADGSAHERFDAEFTDADGIGVGSDVPRKVVEEVAFRTPGFTGWQQERWKAHCGDAAAYLGRADRSDLFGKWAAAVPAIRADLEMDDEDWEEVFARFAKGPRGSPTAYVFRCLHCGALTGYWDSD
jgi:uncharacterized protein CbrC (UPF0167 family)